MKPSGPVVDTAYSDRDFIEIERRAATAWIAFAVNKTDEALQMMRSAVDLEQSTVTTWVPAPVLPAAERLGDLLLNAQRPGQALTAFESSMTAMPNRFNGLYGAAVAAERAGNAAKAKHYFAQLLGSCNSDTSDRPELAIARAHHTSAAWQCFPSNFFTETNLAGCTRDCPGRG